MRKQIAAANWKMNLSAEEGRKLIDDILTQIDELPAGRLVLLAIPFPYLMGLQQTINMAGVYLAAQDCSANNNGAFTGEVSASMLKGIGISYVIIGHSERRQYHHEDNRMLAEKLNRALENDIKPIFCCGEPLAIRENGTQNEFVEMQLRESLFHLTEEEMNGFIVAYEPIWAIGTGLTASSDQSQQMHAHIRSVIAAKYGVDISNSISILYGGSVKGNNASQLFMNQDVDGGLVGGASLSASEFSTIIRSLK